MRKHGVERLTVVVSEPGKPPPYDYDVYFGARFTAEAKQRKAPAFAAELQQRIPEVSWRAWYDLRTCSPIS